MKIVERVYTRDARIPRSADDPDCENGWRCIPIPPTADGDWVIFDTSKDYKTGWQRVRDLDS
jgi:hypothetical protein